MPYPRESARRRVSYPKKKRRKDNRPLLIALASALAVALVIFTPYLLARSSIEAVATMASSPGYESTPMPLWTPQAPRYTPAPTPQPTPVPQPQALWQEEESSMNKQPQQKLIALTFDDGPSPKVTGRILSALEKAGGKATFFMLGENAQAYSQTARQVAQAGHQVATHTNSHKSLIRLTAQEMTKEVELSLDHIEKAAGVRPTLLRPPYGNVNDLVKETLPLPLINWSVDTLDWETRDAQSVYDHILKNVRDGDIILMHDIYESTAQAVERVVPKLVEKGYQLVTVDELFAAKGIPLEKGNLYFSAR